jgi:hypothetical protein
VVAAQVAHELHDSAAISNSCHISLWFGVHTIDVL